MKEYKIKITDTLIVRAEDLFDLESKVPLEIKETASDLEYDVVDEKEVDYE